MMENDAVAKMVRAGLSDDIVIATIKASPGQYDTTTDAVIGLEHAGVSDRVIAAMRSKSSYAVIKSNGSYVVVPVINAAQTVLPPAAPVINAAPMAPAQTVLPPASAPIINAAPTAPAETVLPPASAVPPPAAPVFPLAAQRPTPESVGPTPAANKPRVYLEAASKGTNQNAARDQSMEMSKDIEKDCPGIRVTIIQQMADYTILLNHIEVGVFIRDNQIQIANRDGDLVTRTREGGSINGDVKKACDLILADWGTHSH